MDDMIVIQRLRFSLKNLGLVALICILGIAPAMLHAQHIRSNLQHSLAMYDKVQQDDAVAEELQQIIKVDLDGVTIEQALMKLAEKTNLKLMYSKALLPSTKKITLRKEKISLNNALWQVLDGTGLRFGLSQSQQLILMKMPDHAKLDAVEETITGTVTDAQTGETLPAVNVSVKGTTIGTSTDEKGQYELSVPSLQDTLVFSFVGYKTKEVPIQARTEVNVELASQVVEGEGVVVTGFGEERKEVSIVGSVQAVQAPDEELRTSTSSLSNSFAGRVAGVTAFQRSGEPGANASEFYIRGISTFSGATDPLIIIDGVEASSGDLNALAPEVIESFSILKDATATAVYGSRGANGVMIVTTKSGRDLDKPKINIRLENTVSTPAQVPDFVGAPRFMEMYNQAITARSTGDVPYSQDKIQGALQGRNSYVYPNVDWYDQLFKDQQMRRTANVNVRGGSEKLAYFMSATFNQDNGMLKSFDLNSYDNNISINRYSFQNNLDIDVSPTTTVDLKLNTQLRDYRGPSQSVEDVFNVVMRSNPADFPVMFPQDSTGGVRYGSKNTGYLVQNPFAEMVRGYEDNFQSTVLANITVDQDLGFLTEGLSFSGLASFKNWSSTTTTRERGYNRYWVSDYNTNGSGVDYTLDLIGEETDRTLGTETANTGDRSFYLEARLNYEKQLAEKHNISSMLLYNQDQYDVNNPSDLISSLPRRTMGIAGRLSYSYDDRYLAEFNFGYNGSENFAEGNRFGFFPSAAVGYVVSSEKFWEPLASTISLFKLRASWGLVGNDTIYLPDGSEARYVYLSDINLTGQGFTTGREQNYSRSGPSYNRFANRDITWEEGEKINLGLDLQLFDNLDITVDVFTEHRRNIFLARNTVPTSFGTAQTDIYGNLGEVRNRGLDASINYSKAFSSDFFMALKGTFTYAHNEVLEIDEPPFQEFPNLSQVGHPINSLLGYDAQRLFIDQAEIDNHANQQLGGFVQPGDIMYRDVTGNGLINSDDRIRMGHPSVPEITFGFGPSFQYKNFDFSFLLQGVARTSFFINGFHPFGSQLNRGVLSFIAEDYWSKENPDIFADYPRLSKLDNPNNTSNSSFWLRDGSFVKLRNLELGYRYKFARIYLSGRNLLTFSKFKHWDPEQGGGNGLDYPTQRSFNIGLQLNL